MPIPNLIDRQIGEIEDAGASILVLLRTMKHAAERDIPLHRTRLREMLGDYVEIVMATAPGGGK
jgi:hypothetical protein